MRRRTITNFGGNLKFRPSAFYQPADEAEVLALMKRAGGQRIRVVGALHSWSPCAAGDGLVLDLRRLDGVNIERDGTGNWQVTVGAGCRIRRLLKELRHAGLALPSVGLIDAQSIAGAIATGTHGSGRHSLSHYVSGLRVAAYDRDTGEPVIHDWRSGAGLRAARCGLGCTGVVLDVTLPCVAMPRVEEWTVRHANLQDLLAAAGEYPLTQAYLVPWSWTWLAHHRRETRRSRSWWAPIYRAYRVAGIDYVFHALIRVIAGLLRVHRLVPSFYRRAFPALVLTGTRTVDRMDRILLMHHQAFRHVETELFVPESRLAEAAAFVQQFLVFAAGRGDPPPDAELSDRERSALDGIFVHHFPVTFRRVLPDDTLISMSAGTAEPRWAISLITYDTGGLPDFQAAMAALARLMADRFGARPHWGKHCPLDGGRLDTLYPGLAAFRRFCREVDPDGRFRNEFADTRLGFADPGNGP